MTTPDLSFAQLDAGKGARVNIHLKTDIHSAPFFLQ